MRQRGTLRPLHKFALWSKLNVVVCLVCFRVADLEKIIKVDGGNMPEVVTDMKKNVDQFRQKLEVRCKFPGISLCVKTRSMNEFIVDCIINSYSTY